MPIAYGQPAPLSEYQIKAVFLFNFARFVEWPAGSFNSVHAPLVIGVLGDDPFGRALDDAARDESVDGRALVVRRYRVVGEIGDCHILFISRSETRHLDEILNALKARSLLTVSDTETFAQRGGMIRFVMEKNRVRLRINLAAARAAHLTLSSKLLRPVDLETPEKS